MRDRASVRGPGGVVLTGAAACWWAVLGPAGEVLGGGLVRSRRAALGAACGRCHWAGV